MTKPNAPASSMTKREYFAKAAMAGLLHLPREKEDIARMAVEHADALIAELNKGGAA